ncbi:MAG: bifunctional 5,10-methylenetetrahydrofolate dehydrogenase/5,10-methenyltetrahydrofolate cyclohydrolase, partial [Lachnospiraceae bacterium]|nr:bifunctional 5,10-methylenetetrahydrofolate dehydrogenase/5,10-methenyltetrahydrofolate cyclohydrolase [Lachnospiraceae bacterium]
METRKIDGREIAGQIKEEWKKKIQDLGEIYGRGPALAVVLVGEDPASQIYVRNKKKACETVGMISKIFTFPETASQEEVLTLIERLNKDPEIDGILLQLPLPPRMDAQRMTRAIAPEKDVDGFHPINVGRMAIGLPCFISATPLGILTLLQHYHIETSGKKCVILG